jgi:hypothetical protein
LEARGKVFSEFIIVCLEALGIPEPILDGLLDEFSVRARGAFATYKVFHHP